ncbi:MAG TPA: transketolase C-terminal domain-containing protein [Feifaniaceae bacterium]|nr:transketolase C-terminal domain-containing protein [Feifaniaceae bacterium]
MKIVYNGSMDPVAFKDLLGENIPKIIEKDPNVIYLDADLMSCIGTTKFAQNNPDKAINCGISEANMIGVASGLAAAGFKPIAHTFGIFASRRVFDQVFLSAGYAKNDITVLGTDPGVCAAYNGGTHMPFEDIALYRAIPTATVFDIADTAQLLNVLTQAKDLPGVKYIRVGRKNNAKVYETGSEFPIGKGVTLREGGDAVVFATGIMIHEAMRAAEELAKEGIEVAVVDMFTVKPIDEDCIVKYAKAAGAVVTAENHNKVGGLFSAVSEVLARKHPAPVEYVAVEDVYGQVGPQDYLQQAYGLTKENVVKKVKAVLARKK